MDTPVSDSSRTTPAWSSLIGSMRGCTLGGSRILKEELRQKITIPQYLRLAMRDAIQSKDVAAGNHHYASAGEAAQPPDLALVVFINSLSGGRHGPKLKARVQELMGKEQVFDLRFVKPHEFLHYGLGCLEMLADIGDSCAKETHEKLRVVVAGGDGTVGWVLGSLGELHKQGREPVLPTAIIPLGTGNDLSRSFGWVFFFCPVLLSGALFSCRGGSFPFNWKSAVKRTLDRASTGSICCLDSWNVLISMPAGKVVDPPHALKPVEDISLDQELKIEGELPEKVSCYEGVFYNYFSIGMDAQIAYGFHHLRNEKPYLAQVPFANKLIYFGYGCKQGWFFTPCISAPSLRGLKNILRMYVKKVNCSEWEQVSLPSSVKSIVALNLNNYASGRNPWDNLKPEYLENFSLKQGWHALFCLTLFLLNTLPKYRMLQQQDLSFRGGEWEEAYLQMDGEPWKQPMNKDYFTFVEIKRVPFQSVMVNGGVFSTPLSNQAP
ncbi:Diacylglycerol kinase 7 [Camellia lanceoleosa]|uniref:Diacylglycerol kinase 7 n=1 Tax=Camellia lanceoleosa TaxID=1840588 RepID=A0ACC0FQM2_9ERIC|nr:Diacylglycerol kinase 7 [Camellia lanceoleosa]